MSPRHPVTIVRFGRAREGVQDFKTSNRDKISRHSSPMKMNVCSLTSTNSRGHREIDVCAQPCACLLVCMFAFVCVRVCSSLTHFLFSSFSFSFFSTFSFSFSFSLSLSLSLFLSPSVSVCLCLYVSVSLFLCFFVFKCFCISVSLCLRVPVFLVHRVSLSLCFSVSLFLCISVSLRLNCKCTQSRVTIVNSTHLVSFAEYSLFYKGLLQKFCKRDL